MSGHSKAQQRTFKSMTLLTAPVGFMGLGIMRKKSQRLSEKQVYHDRYFDFLKRIPGAGRVAQVTGCLLSKHEALIQPPPHKNILLGVGGSHL
jgi:hypothetical protein